MKTQIVRLSPHQNAKVFALYAALFALVFVMLMAVAFLFARPLDRYGEPVQFPLYLVALLPILYFIFSYILVAAVCSLYNVGYRFIGGIEFEFKDPNSSRERP
jgi:MFS family permease